MSINSERFNKMNINRGISYLKRNGARKTLYKVVERIKRDEDEINYSNEVMAARPDAEELKRQRSKKFMHSYRFSILVPAYETDPVFLREMLNSVVNQTYTNWEICLADGSASDIVKNEVEKYTAELDADVKAKIRYQKLNRNRGISGNSNAALVMASGDYVGLLDHDDLLAPNALFEIMTALESGMERNGNVYTCRYKAVYSDEDKVNTQVTRYFDYHKKPDFDIDLLRSNNYICHFFAVKASIAVKAGGFRSEYNGAQDHDFILRCVEQMEPSEIYHIDKVLYHWRSHQHSTAENPDSKLYAYEAGKKAVIDHLIRMSVNAEVTDTAHLGFFRVKYSIDKPNVEIIQKDNWDKITREEFDNIRADYIMVIDKKSIKPITKDYIEELAGMLSREEVGAVGGKIYDRHGRIDSAGYSMNENGEMIPNFRGMNGHFSGYLHRASLQHKVDGLATDCMMIKKSAVVFTDKPGMSKRYLVLYDPFAEFKRKG